MKVYTINKLIEGYKIKPELRGKIIVACKSTKGYSHIQYKNQIMPLAEPLTTISQQDQYGRGTYFLDYYEWKPTAGKDLWNSRFSKSSCP